mgnify:CR=1 FL=1
MTKINHMIAHVNAHADAGSIPRPLLLRLVEIESSWNPWAVRYEPQYTAVVDVESNAEYNDVTPATETMMQKCSWGPCQVLGATARRLGYRGPLTRLVETTVNLALATQLLSVLRDSTGKRRPWRWVLTAYNHGPGWARINPRWDRDGYTAQYQDVLEELGEG